MSAGLRTLRQCRACRAITGDIWSTSLHRYVHVEPDPVLIYETKGGEDSGHTLDGKLVRGTVVEHPGSCGAWEVYQEHRCGAAKAVGG